MQEFFSKKLKKFLGAEEVGKRQATAIGKITKKERFTLPK